MKKKLKLTDIQVSSFITDAVSGTIKGGSGDHHTIEIRDCVEIRDNITGYYPSINSDCTQNQAYCNSAQVCVTIPNPICLTV